MRGLFWKFIVVAGCGLMLAPPAFADEAGMLIGAGVGGLAGGTIGHGAGRVAATGAGVFIGGAVGNELTQRSYGYTSAAYAYPYAYSYDMFPPVNYVDRSTYTGPNYVAPPEPPPPQPVTYIDNGNYCRQFSQIVRIGNRTQESYGTACLQPDGSWHIVQ